MKEQTLSRIAVIILAIVLIAFGIYHFLHPDNMIGYVPNFLPGGKIWVYLVGAAFIIVAIALILHKRVKIASYILAIILFSFVLLIHLPNYVNAGDIDLKQQHLISILKDSAIAAFALYLAANAQKI